MPVGDALTHGRVFSIKVMHIEPNPDQPRQEFEPVSLANLASSLRQHGMLQPVIVRPLEPCGPLPPGAANTAHPAISSAGFRSSAPFARDGARYLLIAGERRWRAAQLAGLDEVPALVFSATPPQMLELALVENIQREDLSPLEEARAYEHMINHLSMTQEEVALRVGRHRTTVANRLRLLNLTPAVRQALNERRITEGHARALLALDGARQEDALQEVIRRKLSVRETEGLARRQHPPSTPRHGVAPRETAQPSPLGVSEAAVEDTLRRVLGTKVMLSRHGTGGRIVIEFYSDEELQRVFEQIAGPPDGED
jgi:ParB family chromosome partitioning protein